MAESAKPASAGSAQSARPEPAEADRLRQEIDSGGTRDKVGVSDPAAASLGTDDEAAAAHHEQGLEEARRAPPPGAGRAGQRH